MRCRRRRTRAPTPGAWRHHDGRRIHVGARRRSGLCRPATPEPDRCVRSVRSHAIRQTERGQVVAACPSRKNADRKRDRHHVRPRGARRSRRDGSGSWTPSGGRVVVNAERPGEHARPCRRRCRESASGTCRLFRMFVRTRSFGVSLCACLVGLCAHGAIPAHLSAWPNSGAGERAAGGRCLPADGPQTRAIEERARAAAEATFEAALRRHGLERIELSERTVELAQGIELSFDARPAPADTVVERTVDGLEGHYVAGPWFWRGDATHPSSWEFARAADGSIVRVVRRPEPRARRVVRVCGCEPPNCRFGSPCPACHPTVQRFYGPLPHGTRYAGVREIAYPVTTVERRWEEGSCRRQCPPPPP